MFASLLLPALLVSTSGDVQPLRGASTEPERALSAFAARHGAGWRLLPDPGTGKLQMLSGGRGRPAFFPRVDADFADLARIALAESAGLHGIDADTLVLERVLFLPLGQIGSGDKTTVRFRQAVRGVPVVGGYVNVLFADDGSLLSIQSTGLPGLATFSTAPAASPRSAIATARTAFAARGGPATRVDDPVLVVDPFVGPDGVRSPRLCWQVDVARTQDGFEPEGLRSWIDARDGSLVRSESTVHHFDVGGTVSSMATPGMNPDSASNPPAARPMQYLQVESAAGTTLTDADGRFVFPGASGPLSCTFRYVGALSAVGNAAGADYALTQSLPTGTASQVLMNPSGLAPFTAQANVFASVDKQRDWVRSLNPAEDRMDYLRLAIVNSNQVCNAYFDGSQIVFFAAGSGCPNTAYSTVVSHEDGHWANVVFGTGNGGDGMGEGNADTWAEYVWNTPILAAGFYGSGTILRDGRNTRSFCGDCCGGCYGEVHTDGEVWMGAAWKIRSRLVAAHGAPAGELAANLLFLGWMEAYNQTQIKSVIEAQWLALDDPNGNVDDGTPHYASIDLGFRDQAFPGVDLKPVSFGAVTDALDTEVQLQDQTITATIHANVAPLSTAVLRYRVDGGPFLELPMSNVGGEVYEAALPGELAPAHVEYYVLATDTASNAATYPAAAPLVLLDYDVGAVHVLLFEAFDHAGENGWTHATHGDTSNPADDWSHATPSGNTGTAAGIPWKDPPFAASGPLCFGTGLGHGTNRGAYSPNVHASLRTPSFDASTAVGTHLRFRRWLSIEGSASDRARILVNGTPVFTSPASALADEAWTTQDIDISALADGLASVQIAFELLTNGQNHFGGWQIDDVEVLWVGVAPCPLPGNVCYQSTNSADGIGATMEYSGSGIVANNDLVLRTSACPAGKKGLYLFSRGQTTVPYGDGYLCLRAPIHRLPSLTTDAGGRGAYPLDILHLPGGIQFAPGEDWYFQFLFRDPAAGGSGFNTSDALRVTFCP